MDHRSQENKLSHHREKRRAGVRSPTTPTCRRSSMERFLLLRDSHQTPEETNRESESGMQNLMYSPTGSVLPCRVWYYRAESAGRLDKAGGLEDGIDSAVKLHLSVDTTHRSLLGSNDGHLHLPIVDQRVQDGLDVVHGQIHLWTPINQTGSSSSRLCFVIKAKSQINKVCVPLKWLGKGVNRGFCAALGTLKDSSMSDPVKGFRTRTQGSLKWSDLLV